MTIVQRTETRAEAAGPDAGTERTRRRQAGRRSRTTLGPLALLDLVKEYGRRVPPWQGQPGDVLASRTYELVDLSDELEVWVIQWPTGGHLQLHDHGGSAGAFWVVGGELEERYHAPREPRAFGQADGTLGRRRHGAGSGMGFGGEYLHDVRNGGPVTATSVHAYSPPMPAMTYYLSTPAGPVAERTEYRSDPSWAP